MIRIAALNDSDGNSSVDSAEGFAAQSGVTKEALENAAYSLYNKCLGYERAGLLDKAAQSFELLLENEFLAQDTSKKTESGQLFPCAILKYSALKNLAQVYSRQGKNQQAFESLLQAIEIDFTDVTVCYKLGLIATKLNHLVLASRAFQKGLELSASHWLCLDNLLTILYALDNYEGCLYYIAEGLKRDSGYVKGLVLRKAIYKEQPCLRKLHASAFSHCNMEEVEEYTQALDPTDEQEVLARSQKLRDIQMEACKPKAKPAIDLRLSNLRWSALGQRLLDIYAYIEDQAPALDHSCKLVMNTTTNESPTHMQPSAGLNNTPPASSELTVDRPATHCPMDTSEILGARIQANSTSSGSDTLQHATAGMVASDSDQSLKEVPNMFANSSSASVSDSNGQAPAPRHDVTKKHITAVSPDEDCNTVVTELVESLVGMVSGDSREVESVVNDLVSKVSEREEAERIAVRIVGELLNKVVEQTTAPNPHKSASEDHIYAKQSVASTNAAVETIKKTAPSLAADRKRRSARVKITTAKHGTAEDKKKKDGVDHMGELEQLVPGVLRSEESGEHSYHQVMIVNDEPSISYALPSTTAADNPFTDEANNVKHFLAKFESNRGVVHVMREWVYAVCDQRNYTWTSDLIDTFILVYEKHSNSYQKPNIFTSHHIERDAMAALVWMELYVDQLSAGNKNHNKMKELAYLFTQDFPYWRMVVNNKCKLLNYCEEYSVRYYYMVAQYYTSTHESALAANVLRNLLEVIGENSELSLSLHNSQSRTIIQYNSVLEELTLLERALSLDELQTVYDNGNNLKVIDLLSVSFEVDIKKRYTDSRYSQLGILLKTVERMPETVDNIKWLAEALQEAMHHSDTGRHGNWSSLICRTLALLSDRLTVTSARDSLPSVRVKVVKNCLTVIRLNIESLEANKDMLVKTVHPWILLSKLIQCVQGYLISPRPSSSPSTDFPLHLQVLLKAHSLLAKYSLCTRSDGQLLLYTMNELQEHRLSSECGNQQHTDQQIHQCIYCLYGHPNKKIKAKNLTDHGSPTVTISWSVAQRLFDFYKPKSVPEFDSYKSSTISAELEHLLRRLVAIVPQQCQPDPHTEATVDSYLTKSCSLEEVNRLSVTKLKNLCSECFYLLADYYFKNKEPLKAIKHYVHDLYYKPDRFDSWAGMALAKSSKLESKLSLMERQCYDGAFQKLAVSTMQSFRRALQLHHDNAKLWIEYACSAYQLHSFASRVMKTKKLELSETELSTFTQLKSEMLEKSNHCYMEASGCGGEEGFEEAWLCHYMLGKICEKTKRDPHVYLKHYTKAAKCLHEDGAQYPGKISYMYNPPYLAVEALEMYYRVHATILKSLQRDPSTLHYQLYTRVILDMKQSPFATAQVSLPPTPVSKRKRTAATAATVDPVDRSTPKRRKSETENFTSVGNAASITTRRQGKLKLDAEVISELMEEILSDITTKDGGEEEAQQTVTADTSCTDKENNVPVGCDDEIMEDVRTLLGEALENLGRNIDRLDSSPEGEENLSMLPILNSSPCGNNSPDSINTAKIGKLIKDLPLKESETVSAQEDQLLLDNSGTAVDAVDPQMEIDAQDDSSSSLLIQKIETFMQDVVPEVVRSNSSIASDAANATDIKEMAEDSDCMIIEEHVLQPKEVFLGHTGGSYDSIVKNCMTGILDKLESTDDSIIVLDNTAPSVGKADHSTDSSIELFDVSGRSGTAEDKTIITVAEANVATTVDLGIECSLVKRKSNWDSSSDRRLDLGAKSENATLLKDKEILKAELRNTDPSTSSPGQADNTVCPENELSSLVGKDGRKCDSSDLKEQNLNKETRDARTTVETSRTSVSNETRVESSSDVRKAGSTSAPEKPNSSSKEVEDTNIDEKSSTPSVTVILSKDELIESCIKALKLCILRYPLHYKSYFRLGKTFLHDKQRKDVDKVHDLLLGNSAKRKEDKFVPQGLFQDRKHNNFFNGVWRNPVEEIERAGSFGAHLYKTIHLLLQFLHEKRDYHLLYQLHTQLQRTPEPEKKFLKDADRLSLSSKAMEFAIHSLYKVIGLDASSKVEYNYAASLHQAYKWYNYCNRTSICVPNSQVLLMKAYKSYKLVLDKDYNTDMKIPVSEAKEFCQQMFSNRSKDKNKAADPNKQSAVTMETSKTQNSSSTKERESSVAVASLPTVRGSLQTFDKSKKARVVLSTVRTEAAVTVEHAAEKDISSITEVKSVNSADIPVTSWLHKAKEGTSALASMFEKPKPT